MKSLKERMTEATMERFSAAVGLLPITNKLQAFKIFTETLIKMNVSKNASLQPANLPVKNSFADNFWNFPKTLKSLIPWKTFNKEKEN